MTNCPFAGLDVANLTPLWVVLAGLLILLGQLPTVRRWSHWRNWKFNGVFFLTILLMVVPTLVVCPYVDHQLENWQFYAGLLAIWGVSEGIWQGRKKMGWVKEPERAT